MIAKVRIPNEDSLKDDQKNTQSTKTENNKVTIETKIVHEGEVNRVSHMPQNSNIIATKTTQGDVLVFDYQKHPTNPESDKCKPNIRLKGLQDEGYALGWNPH